MAAAYAEAYPEYIPDTRHRGRVSIAHVLPPSRDISRRGGFAVDLVFSSILGKSVLALGLHLTKEWLLASSNGSSNPRLSVGETHWRLLAISAILVAVWHKPWDLFSNRMNYTRLLTYSALVCAESYAYMTALDKLPVLRLVMLSEACHLWTHGLQSMRKKGSSTARNANFVTVATLGASYIAELYLNKRISKNSVNVGYFAVLCYLFLKATAIDTLSSISPNGTPLEEELQARYHSLGLIAAIPIALFFSIIPTSTSIPAESSYKAGPPVQTTLATLSLLAFALFVADPILNRAVGRRTITIRGFKGIWTISVLAVAFIGVCAFERTLHIADFVIGSIAYLGISHILHSDPRLAAEAAGRNVSSFVNGHTSTARKGKETVLESIERKYRQIRATIKTILENPDSKKIYYFLCLNLAFMFVQMMYGIWTNSLGLISDSIHMFFDCLALAMGLLASVMATWPRNETFTYGYVRVETLSGFANGIFLVLISIFIVFEAVQRLIDPPEMNTNQLLTVSALGLAVNLVGMFATGHHHHGHSHGHDDHGHDHGHSHGRTDSTHSHGVVANVTTWQPGHSHNMHGVFLHVMADTLGSCGVIVSTLLINRYGWTGFDPIASIFIAVLIFASVIPLILDSASLLCLDLGTGREKDVRSALAKLSSVEGLSSYGAARFWPKDPSTVVGSIHIQLAPSPSHDHKGPSHGSNGNTVVGFSHYANAEKVVRRVESVLKGAIDGLVELSVQIEPSEGDISCPCMISI